MNNIAIVGRGSIALLIALELYKKYPNKIITLYGAQNKYSASYAAGAMINILSEIDCFNIDSPLTHWKLKNRNEAIKEWDMLDEFLIKNQVFKNSIYTSSGTEISVQINSINEVEKRSFNAILKAAKKYNVDIETDISDLKRSILIKDEKSIDSNLLLKEIDSYLQKRIKFINYDVKSLKKLTSNNWSLTDSSNVERKHNKVIIACGAWSEKLIVESKDILSPTIRGFYGFGSALLIKSELPYVKTPELGKVQRTPNRGGTCGIHGLERNNCIYIGASSHVTHLPLRYPKAPSIQTLLEGAESVLGIDIYDLSFEVAMGYRPLTSDLVPIIGSLSKNLWCIYGTKRDGLTWAPYFAKYLVHQLFGNVDKNWKELIKICSPYRDYISAGEVNSCIQSYILNKKFESFQHNRTFDKEYQNKLELIAKNTHHFINKNRSQEIGLHPEIINILYYTNFDSINDT